MKQILRFKLHSLIDVITNSSTEIFICNTDKSVEMVTELLKEMLGTYCKMHGDDKFTFDRCFNPVYKLETDVDIKIYLEGMAGQEIDYPPYSKESKEKWMEEIVEAERKWIDKEMNENINKYRNCIIISSADDNSIPFELFDMIDYGFNAQKTHLG